MKILNAIVFSMGLISLSTAAFADGESITRGPGRNCQAHVTCSSGRTISCSNANVDPSNYSVCMEQSGGVGLVACSIDDGHGTVIAFSGDSCP